MPTKSPQITSLLLFFDLIYASNLTSVTDPIIPGSLEQLCNRSSAVEGLRVELSDGWYSIAAGLDGPLAQLVLSGRLVVSEAGWGGKAAGREGGVQGRPDHRSKLSGAKAVCL